MLINNPDTICAIATASGRGGIGIVRISGPLTKMVSQEILGFKPVSRQAHSSNFLDAGGKIIDSGIAIFYEAPNSFTGEDVLELQGHGGTQILKAIMARVLDMKVRQARAGEFSERAFLNDKIDLVQAEAIADLIDAGSKQAARSAMRTLQGEFSRRIAALQQNLTSARISVEAAIDFSDEDIDTINDEDVANTIEITLGELDHLFQQAHQGALLKNGMTIAIAGKPNAGKSSLLNALAGEDSAIVTDIPGTTRDTLRVEINLDGMPVHCIDTAGLRQSGDVVEQEGIRRAKQAINQADQILLVADSSLPEQDVNDLLEPLMDLESDCTPTPSAPRNVTIIRNKIDLLENCQAGIGALASEGNSYPQISMSAKSLAGLDILRGHLKQIIGFQPSDEGDFAARERHLKALARTKELLEAAHISMSNHSHLELVAEDLRLAQQSLATITGEFTSDDLLGEIFSSFCIGK